MQFNRCGLSYYDKVVIITGGSKGIGKGCANIFVDAGSKVVICARDKETGEKLSKELNDKGPGSCYFIQCDVSKEEDIDNLINEVISMYGKLDCLINNAGYHPPHKVIDDFTADDLIGLFKTNIVSYFIACKSALPYLRKTKGNIINMGSLVGITGQEGATTYCATKGAISGFTKSLAIEECRNNVRVNCVLPGNILTQVQKDTSFTVEEFEEFKKHAESLQPIGRCGTSEEVGQACLFLASDLASYITGAEIIISGGSELGYGVKYPFHFI